MKSFISIFFIVIITQNTYAQNVHFDWAKQMGGTGAESGNAIAQDASGNIYTTGNFINTVDFDPGAGIFNLSATDNNIFVSKLDADGNFLWAKHFANTSGDGFGKGMTIDPQGNIYVTGTFSGTVDFDPGPNIFNLTAGNKEIFALKLDTDGNFIWVKKFGESADGSGQGNGSSIALDFSGIVIAGTYHGVGDFDPGAGIFNIGASSASSCCFVTKLDLNGNYVWTKATEGGSFSPNIYMTLDNIGNIFVTGGFVGITDFDPGTAAYKLTSTSIVSTNIFIFKLTASGDFGWAKMMLGGPGFGASITTDNTGNVYSTGKFAGTVDFDPGTDTHELAYTGTADIYISILKNNGDFINAIKLGGNNDSEGTGIALDNGGNIYITGTFSGTVDFNPGSVIYNLTASGGGDIFVTKINSSGNLSWAVNMGGNGLARANAICEDAAGDVYTTGYFEQAVDFDFSAADFTLTSKGDRDIFIHKIKNCVSSIPNTITAAACNSYTLNSQIYTATGTYLQTLVNASGCDSLITLKLTIGPVKTMLDVTTCESSYYWNGHTYNNSGTYNDTLISAAGCDSIITLKLSINSNTVSSIYDTICPGENYYGHTIAGIYTDKFSAANGCDSTRTLHLAVKYSCIPMNIPNAFTPNGDVKNDIFKPTITNQIKDYSMIIYNRFGEKIFESRSYLSGWDGNCKGKAQPMGSYIYIIRYRDEKGLLTEEKGTVLLLK